MDCVGCGSAVSDRAARLGQHKGLVTLMVERRKGTTTGGRWPRQLVRMSDPADLTACADAEAGLDLYGHITAAMQGDAGGAADRLDAALRGAISRVAGCGRGAR